MKAIVELVRYEDSDQLSMTTSCGATVCQALRSNSTYQQAMMREWADEQESASRRRLIWEINYDLAKVLLLAASSYAIPRDLVEELKHKFPELKDERNPKQSAGKFGPAEIGLPKEEAEPGDSRGKSETEAGRLSGEPIVNNGVYIELVYDFVTGKMVTAKWNGQQYSVEIPESVNKEALSRLIRANGYYLTVKGNTWEFGK